MVATPSPDDFRRLVTQELEKVKTERESHRKEVAAPSKESQRLSVADTPVAAPIKTAPVEQPTVPTITPPVKTAQGSLFAKVRQHLVTRAPNPVASELLIEPPVEPKSASPAVEPKPTPKVDVAELPDVKLPVVDAKPAPKTTKPSPSRSEHVTVTPKVQSRHAKPDLDMEFVSLDLKALEASLSDVLANSPKTPRSPSQQLTDVVTPVVKSKRTLIERLEAEVTPVSPKPQKTPKPETQKTPKPETPKSKPALKTSPRRSKTPPPPAEPSAQDLCEDLCLISTEMAEKAPPITGLDVDECDLKERLRNFTLVHPNDYHLIQDGDVVTYINQRGKVIYDAVIRGNKTTRRNLKPVWIVEINAGAEPLRYVMGYTSVQKLWKRVRVDTAVLAKCVDMNTDDIADIIEYLTLKFESEFTDYIEYKRSLRAPRVRPGDPVTGPGEPTIPIPPPPTRRTPNWIKSSKSSTKSPKRTKSPAKSPAKSPKRTKSPARSFRRYTKKQDNVINVTRDDL